MEHSQEFLDLKQKCLFIYEYTAPPDGQIAISFEEPESHLRPVCFSAFLNHRIE